MALDPRKRQRKLDRKKAKARRDQRHARREPQSMAGKLERFASKPVVASYIAAEVFSTGMGTVHLGRAAGAGMCAYAHFLVDAYCVGVKDVFCDIMTRERQQELLDDVAASCELLEYPPESVRKFVEGAVEFAGRYGIAPHADYRKARVLFGDLDPGQSTDEFTYGRNGRPLYISSPFDSWPRQQQIMNLLAAHSDALLETNPELEAEDTDFADEPPSANEVVVTTNWAQWARD